MSLIETFETVRPSIVALGSRLVRTAEKKAPAFPAIIGTGFVVDKRGIVMTNRHVAEALYKLPPKCAMAIVFPKEEENSQQGEWAQPLLFREVVGYNMLEQFHSKGPFYGELLPDISFVQIDLTGVAPLEIDNSEFIVSPGRDVATAGFALGTDPLVMQSRVVQLMPFLRRGIISSVYPFRGPHPHGFTIDVMMQGGGSGSPIFLPDTGKVIGIIYAGYPGTNITIAAPASIVNSAVNILKDTEIDLRESEDFASAIRHDARDGEPGELSWTTIEKITGERHGE